MELCICEQLEAEAEAALLFGAWAEAQAYTQVQAGECLQAWAQVPIDLLNPLFRHPLNGSPQQHPSLA